jgi:hypothetical protein
MKIPARLSLIAIPWMLFPLLNLVLSAAGVIEINSPPGPPVVNEHQAGRQSIVVGCDDVLHQMPAYPRPYPEYFPGWLDEDRFPTEARISRIADFVFPPVTQTIKYTIRESLRLAARRSRAVGSDLSADNLEHFLNNSGETVTDFNVEGLLRDLPVLHELVRQTLNSSTSSLVQQQLAEPSSTPCRQFSSEPSPWIVTGLGGNPSIMPNIHIDARPGSPTFDLLYAHPDYEFRDELDVWMGMDPIWYALGQSVIVNMDTQQAELCYQVFIYFPYRWYDAGFVDRIMGLTDGLRISEHYDLEGTSGSRCEAFNVGDGSPQVNFPAFRVTP